MAAWGLRTLFALAFPAAVAIVLLRVPLWLDADGLLETIMSLQRVTLFYWGQSRFANLLPLLTAPIRGAVANADAQLTARIVLGLLAPVFACALVSAREARFSVMRATILSALLFLATGPYRIVYEALAQPTPFGTSIALAGLSVLAFRRAATASRAPGAALRWRVAGAALAVAAFGENVSLVLEAAPLAIGLCVLARSRVAIDFAWAAALALAATMLAMKLGGPADAPHIDGFGHSLLGLRAYGGYLIGPRGFCFWATLALAIAGHGLGRREAGARGRLLSDLVLVATIAVSFIATGLSDWVVTNAAHPRYVVPDYLLAASLGGVAIERIVHMSAASRVRQECRAIAAAATLLVVAVVRTGPPPADGETLIEPQFQNVSKAVASAIVSRHLDGVAGDYWDVWPAIFRVEASGHTAFGFAEKGFARHRAIARRLWKKGQLRVGCIEKPGEECAAAIRLTTHIPLRTLTSGEPPLPLEGGRRLTTLLVTPAPGPAKQPVGARR